MTKQQTTTSIADRSRAGSIVTGLADPVAQSQAVFRAVMNAMARPGSRVPLPSTTTPGDKGAGLNPPANLPGSLAAIALALADFETPLWLAPQLRQDTQIVDYLRFYCGAPLVEDPIDATFALIADGCATPPLETFAQGTLAYPDRSTTLIIAVSSLTGGAMMRLTGPGVDGTSQLAPTPTPRNLANQLRENRGRFPCGVDLIFATANEMAALPRSVRVQMSDSEVPDGPEGATSDDTTTNGLGR